MKNQIKQAIAVAAIVIFAAAGCGRAYGQNYMVGDRQYSGHTQQNNSDQPTVYYSAYARPYNVDFIPPNGEGGRFAIALQPLVIFNKGMRVDFEFELRKPGNWIQVGLSGYYSQWFDNDNSSFYYWRSGWATMNSGFDEFQKLSGGGLSLAYKNMISRNGFYTSFGASFIYYDVHHYAQGLFSYVENGNTYYEEDYRIVNTQYYRPTAFINLGRTFAARSGLILDFYGGVGYTHSIYDDSDIYSHFNSGWMAFGYRGFHLTGGIRIGVLWQGKAREAAY